MQEYLSFLANHIVLATAWAAIAFLLVTSLVRSALSGVKSLAPQAVTSLINGADAVVVDVRSKAEFAKGHIPGSLSIPLEQLAEESSSALENAKDKPIILVCATGMRAGDAAMTLRKSGFAQVHKLAGGISAWTGANLPLVKK